MQSKPETYKGKFYFKVISCACAICAGSSPLVFSAQAESDRVHWTEFREIYDRINKTTDKAKKSRRGNRKISQCQAPACLWER